MAEPINIPSESSVSTLDSAEAKWRLNTAALTDAELADLARLAAERVGSFGRVEGVPPHGLRLADALRRHATRGPLLLVDEVLVSGATLEAQREGRDAVGVVVVALGPCPEWVKPVFVLGKLAEQSTKDLEALKQRLFYWAPSRAPDTMAAIDALGKERNQLLLSTELAESKADLVEEAAVLLRQWRLQAEARGELPAEVRYWLARFESLQAHGGC